MASLSEENYNPEEYLLNTLNDLDIGFVKVSNDGVILKHNLTFNKIFGFNPEKNLIGTKTLDYWLNSEERNKFREILYKNGIVKKYIAPVKKVDGEKIFLQVNFKLNWNPNGEIVSSEGTFVDVTESIETEQKLSESEMNYKNLIEHLGMHLMIIDRDEIFQVVNEKASESMGGKPTDFIGKSLNDIFPKDIAEKYIKVHQGIFKSGKGITFEHTLNLPTGTRTFYTSEQPIKDMQGNIISVQIISLDVTEPKIIKQKLKESEGNLEKITDAFIKFKDDPLFNLELLINTAGILLKADCAMVNILKKVNGKDILETITIYKEPPGFIKESEAEGHICSEIIKDNTDEVVILKNLDKSKYAKTDENVQKYNLKQYVSFILRLNKIPVGTFCVVYMDNREMSENDIHILKILSQSTSIELARWKSLNKLRKSEEKYRTLFDSSKDGIIFTNMEGKILDCNRAYLDMLGYTMEEIKEFTYQQLTPEKWHEMEADIITNKFIARGYSDEYEKEYIKNDGTIFPISIKGWTIKDEKGKPMGMWGFIRDVSKRKKAENLIKKELKKLKELEEIRKDFIIRVSHEMRTPLIPVYNASQLLLTEYKDRLDSKVFELVELVNKGGERLKKLVDDIIDASRIEFDKFKLRLSKENLIKIIKDAIDDMKYLVSERNLFLNFDLPFRIKIDVDKNKIKRVFTNILSNAIKNTPPKGKINIYLRDSDEYIDICIRDTGVGLTENEKQKLFQKFGKIERYGKGMDIDTEGSGLGLYLSKEIIRLHGGQIFIESKGRNTGAEFIIRLYKKNPYLIH